MKNLLTALIMLVVGFSMGHLSAGLVQINPWALSAFVCGLGLALGYVSRQQQGSSS